LEKLGQNYFPGGVQSVDFDHALEHLEAVLALRWEKTTPEYQRHRSRWIKLLLSDGVGKIIKAARAAALLRRLAEPMEKALGYFEHNVERMQDGSFRRRGFFIGSGVIEAGCKTLSAPGANNQACSGRSPEPKRSSPFAAFISADGPTPSGKTASTTAPLKTIFCSYRRGR
jgi:hypothetical protein